MTAPSSSSAADKPLPVTPILIAMVLGVLAGMLSRQDLLAGLDIVPLFDFLGTVFINALKMLIVPLVAASIITSVAGLGTGRDLGRLGVKAFSFYVITTLIAVLIALVILNVVKPGIVDGVPAHEMLALDTNAASVAESVTKRASVSVFDTLSGIVPPNIVEAAAGTKLLSLVFFCFLFGFFLARIELPGRAVVHDFWAGVFQIMMRMTHWVMRFAPVGVFGLTARAAAKSGFDAAGPILAFGACVIVGLAVYALIALPLLVRIVARVNPWRLFPAMSPAMITAFSTASSSATLPISLECVEKRAHVSERVTHFVIPLGTSVNHAGSALYECAAALFIAQAYGVELSFSVQFTVVIFALLASMGIAGIPAASLVGIAVILSAVGLPPEAIGVVLVLDRPLDMLRTSINILADGACAVIVARLEGEPEVLAAGVPPTKLAG